MSAFYDLASLVLVPSGYKASKVYAQKPLTTDGQLAFTRASTATRVNSAGLIKKVALNVPRLDYLNSSCPRLLLEPQRTNIALFSEQMDNASWIKLNGAVTANAGVSPDGSTNADKFVPNTTSGIHALRSNLFNQSATAAHSWFVKADGYSKVAVRESELVGNYASFNLATGTLISTNQTGSIVNYGNGWYRLTLVDTTTGVNAQTSIVVLPDSYTTGDPIINWSGDGTKGVLAYGCQVELGAYATSYIPTLGAAVTRGADAARTASGVTSIFNSTWTAFGELVIPARGSAGVATGFGLKSVYGSDNVANWVLGVAHSLSTTSAVDFVFYVSGGAVKTVTQAITYGTPFKFAVTSDGVVYVNGVQVSASSSLTPATPVEFGFGRLGQTDFSNGEAERVAQALLFKSILPPADLAALTA